MLQNLWNAVLITLIGMGLVFVGILLLWGLMALLVLIKDSTEAEEEAEPARPARVSSVSLENLTTGEAPAAPAQVELAIKQEAAAVAVAVALAIGPQLEQRQLNPPQAGLSAWQAFNRTNQIGVKQAKGRAQ